MTSELGHLVLPPSAVGWNPQDGPDESPSRHCRAVTHQLLILYLQIRVAQIRWYEYRALLSVNASEQGEGPRSRAARTTPAAC